MCRDTIVYRKTSKKSHKSILSRCVADQKSLEDTDLSNSRSVLMLVDVTWHGRSYEPTKNFAGYDFERLSVACLCIVTKLS